MAAKAKVHKSLRLDAELVERVEALRYENEPLTHTMCRVMAVGCDTLEGEIRSDTLNHARLQAEHAQETDENTRKLIALLEKDIERLTAEHERDVERIVEKDKLIAKAMDSAHDLAEQAHIVAGIAYDNAGAIGDGNTDDNVLDVEPLPERIGFFDWLKYYRVGKRKA